MEATLGFQTKREVILQMTPRYRRAPISQKGKAKRGHLQTVISFFVSKY